ncbi:MAG TPA: hypothetical protein PKD51_00695 [Saprospiraceae bacterium]|nr:hypothetical protein [Saprospiraceae bacterium]
MNKILLYSLLFLCCLIISCRKDEILPIGGQDVLSNTENVSFIIQIIDEKNNGIPNATLMMQGIGNNYTSDQNGFIIVKNISVPAIGIYTTVLAPSYHKQIKLLNGEDNSNNIKYIKMVPIAQTNTIATGNEDWINGRGKLKLPDVLIRPDGSTYQGNVIVYSNYFDPDTRHFLMEAPGNMLALNADNQITTLASMGMYRIELFSESGEVLKIRQGDKATLSFPIANLHQGIQDNSVPLWSLNEDTGLWIREGEATLNGQFMVAEVGHFSFWNLDFFYEFEEICFTFKTNDGNLISGLNLNILVNSTFPMAFETTNSEGKICLRIPLGQLIKIHASLADFSIQTFEVGPFNAGANDVELALVRDITEVKGKAVTCEMNLVKNGFGFAYTSVGGQTQQIIPINEDGSFRYYTAIANALTLINTDNNQSYNTTFTPTQLENDIDLGIVQLCANIVESKISGYVLIDNNEDGLGDLPVNNQRILIDPFPYQEGQTKTVYTNDLGYYELTVLPGAYSVGSYDEVSGYTYIGCGDISIDDANNDKGEIEGTHELFPIVLPNENDQDNNFIYSITGSGTIGGKVMIDMDNDGVGDKTAQGMVILYGHSYNNTPRKTITTDENGRYRTANDVLPHLGTVEFDNKLFFTAVSDYDVTPDPDGDDLSLGSNYTIPIRLKNNEVDDDNDFVVSINNSVITVRVLVDTDNDGIGDVGIGGQRIELYRRSETGVPQTPLVQGRNTLSDGYCTFASVQTGEYVLYYIGSPDYSAKSGVDMIPDNNPANATSEKFFLPVDIVGKEYDDGNTFIVKKN